MTSSVFALFIDRQIRSLFKAVLIVSFIVTSGCADKKSSEESSKLKASRLIDAQRSDEAIELLERELAHSPLDTELKLVLASAYAHKAGFKVQNLVPFFAQADALNKMSEPLEELAPTTDAAAKIDAFARNTARTMMQFAQVLQVYSAIPNAEAGKIVYLKHAIDLMNEVGKNLRPEDAVYRAVLEIVLFKSVMTRDLIGEFMTPSSKEKNCRLDLVKVNDSFLVLGRLIVDILHDISLANPSRTEEMNAKASQCADMITNLTLATTSLVILDEGVNTFLNEVAQRNGFGKIFTCD